MKNLIFILMALSTGTFAADGGTLTLFVNPAQKFIKFNSPRSMVASFGKSFAKQYVGNKFLHMHKGGMGHAVARVDCTDTKGQEHSFFAGLSGQYSTEQDKIDLFEDKLGLGVLFREYADGYIQASSYVRMLIGDHRGRLIRDGSGVIKRMTPKFMSFSISGEQCENAVDYYETFRAKAYLEAPTREEYVTMAPNEPLYFSFNYDPYQVYQKIKREGLSVEEARMGGGCSSFASGFLKAAGVFQPIFDKLWRINLDVGESFIGGDQTGREVSVNKFIFSGKWSKPGEKTRHLSFYHPENIWAFFEGVEDCAKGNLASRFCTPTVRSWVRENAKKLRFSEQKIKYEKEKKKGEALKKVKYFPGTLLLK